MIIKGKKGEEQGDGRGRKSNGVVTPWCLLSISPPGCGRNSRGREPVPPGGADEGSEYRRQHPLLTARASMEIHQKYKYTRNMLMSADENSRAAEPDDIAVRWPAGQCRLVHAVLFPEQTGGPLHRQTKVSGLHSLCSAKLSLLFRSTVLLLQTRTEAAGAQMKVKFTWSC